MNDKPYTLDDYNQKVLKDITKRFAIAQTNELLTRENYLSDLLFYGYKPLTRWQRFKYKLKDYKQRCKDIWTIVSGGDIHRNCIY